MSEDNAYNQMLKGMLAQKRNEDNDQFKHEKDIVSKYTELFFKARESGDMTLQRHIISSARDYLSLLSPQARLLMEPITRATPFSPQAHKMEMYDKINPMPRITADPDEDPHAYAQQVVDRQRWKDARIHFATGQTPQMNSLVSKMGGRLGDAGSYIIQDKDGRASIMSDQDLAIAEFAKKFGTNPGEVMANGGAYGKPIKVNVGGVMQEYRPFTSLTSGKTTLQLDSGITQKQMDDRYKSATELLATLAAGDEKLISKNPLASLVQQQYKSNELFEAGVGPTLEQAYPGITFIKPKEKASVISEALDLVPFVGGGNYVKGNKVPFVGGYVEGDNTTIVMRPGVRTQMDLGNGRVAKVIYDEQSDSVFDTSNGSRLGSWEEAYRGIQKRYGELEILEGQKKKREEEEESRRDMISDMDISSTF
jgi:hypothetical protein